MSRHYYVVLDPQTRAVETWYALDYPAQSPNYMEISEDDLGKILSLPAAMIAKDGTITEYTPPKTLEGQKAQLDSIIGQKKSLGVYFQPSMDKTALLFSSDDTAYANIVQEAQVVQLGAWADGTQWTLADGSSTPMTGADVTGLLKKVSSYRSACQNYAATLKYSLEKNLDTDLTSGWPSNQ